jgi:protease I
MSTLAGKHAVFVIAFRGFRDEELLEPTAHLASLGARVTVASSALGEAHGMLGARVTPDVLYSALRVRDLDALVFVGGEGAVEYWDDKTAQRLARDAVSEKKVLGAICFAGSLLANAQVLEGRKATAFPTRLDHLRAKGALVRNEPVVTDGNLVTAQGPEAAAAFGRALAQALGGGVA